MTVTQYSAHLSLLLLIALATITLGTQPVREDVSEGESTSTGGCISDWREMKKAYLERQSSADVENSIFDFYPSDAINYGVLVMFYDMEPPPNTSTSGRRECCQRGSKDCFIYFIYRHTAFIDIHPRLFYSRTGHSFNSFSSYRTHQLCWAPPPLCWNRSSEAMLHEFSTQFVGLVMEESSFQVEMSANVHVPLCLYGNHLALTAISTLMFATVGLFLVLYMHHSWRVVGTVLAQSQVARHTVWSTMLVSWVLLPWAMVHFYMVTKEMAEAVQEKRPLTLFQDVYSPQVTAGYVQLGFFLAMLLLEAPFLCVFFLRKATDLHNRRQQLSKTDCRLCYWFTVLCDTLGGIGVVAASQITSVYFFYCALYLIVTPTLIVAWMSHSAAIFASSLVCITILLHTLSFSCKTCSFGKITKGLAFLLLVLLNIAINSYLFQQVRRDKQASHDVIHNLLRSLVSSIVIGINGYAVKRLLFPKKGVEETERGNQELKPLIKGDDNFP